MRLVLAVSLDGRLALPCGGKTQLGGKGDRKVLEAALAWSDCTLMGRGTLTAHQTTCLITDPKLLKQRESDSKTSQPISIVVSTNKEHCPEWPFFQQPVQRWLISPNHYSDQSIANSGYERLLPLKDNWSKTLAQLTDEGLSRLVVLGGAKLVSSLLSEDQIDELQLTLAPILIGGAHTWIETSIGRLPKTLGKSGAWHLTQTQILEDNEFMLRYCRNRSSFL